MAEPDGWPHRERVRILQAAREHLWPLADDPGPMVSKGRIVTDPATGQAVVDTQLKLDVIKVLCHVNRQVSALLPSLASASLEEIREVIERVKLELREHEEEPGEEDGTGEPRDGG